MRIILLILISLLLTNCAANRSQVGSIAGATTTTGACVTMGVDNPYAIAACAMTGAFAGAEIMYNSDYDVHNAVFVDHLNTAPGYGSSYTNWYNQKTGNSGIIKISKSYMVGPFKCKEYDATVDITSRWPLVGVVGVKREVVFGTACQTPDGQWIEKP